MISIVLVTVAVGYCFGIVLLGLVQVYSVIVAVIGGLLFLLNLTARLVHTSYDGGRLLAYRILMGVEYGIIAILAVLCICLL